MELRPAIQVQTIIKAMMDVVLPAVDPNNRIAQEQAHLVVGMLNLLAQRMPLMYRYDRDELARSLALADTLQNQAKDIPAAREALHALASCVEAGEDILDRARAEPGELEAANFELRAKVSALITAVFAETNPSKLKHISSTVTAHAKEQLLRERSWLIAQGFEADPSSVPPIETLI